MTDAERFWDRTAEKYARKPIKDPEAYERTLEHVQRHLRPDDRVLEAGCGTGTTALRLAPHVGHIVARDISGRMIEIAKDKAKSAGVGNVRFERGTLFDAGLDEGAFDVAMAFNFLHLLDDLPAALRRIHALLAPGGRFLSKTVCLAEKSRWFAPLLGLMKPLGLAPPVRSLRVAELEGRVVEAGFETVEAESYGGSLPTRFLVARRV